MGEIHFPQEEEGTASPTGLTLLVFAHMTTFVAMDAETPGLNVSTLETQRERRLSVSRAGLEGG